MMQKSKIFLYTLAFALIFMGFFANTDKVQASSADNVSGWWWSSTTGWISLNCTNDSSCGGSNYGVNEDASGNLNGWAWSDNIGWIQFGGLDLTNVPNTGLGTIQSNANINATTGNLTGWVRAYRAIVPEGQTLGGWDGWISLSGTGYGMNISDVTSGAPGYAWGGDGNGTNMVGWIQNLGIYNSPIIQSDLTLTSSPACVAHAGDPVDLTFSSPTHLDHAACVPVLPSYLTPGWNGVFLPVGSDVLNATHSAAVPWSQTKTGILTDPTATSTSPTYFTVQCIRRDTTHDTATISIPICSSNNNDLILNTTTPYVNTGDTPVFNWSSASNIAYTSCFAISPSGYWGSSSIPLDLTSGADLNSPSYKSDTSKTPLPLPFPNVPSAAYQIKCHNPNDAIGTYFSSNIVYVRQQPSVTPAITSFSGTCIKPNNHPVLSWTTTGMDYCSAIDVINGWSSGPWSLHTGTLTPLFINETNYSITNPANVPNGTNIVFKLTCRGQDNLDYTRYTDGVPPDSHPIVVATDCVQPKTHHFLWIEY